MSQEPLKKVKRPGRYQTYLTKKIVKQNTSAISVSDTCVWNMQFSWVKTNLGVIIEVKIIFVLEFYLHFHCSSHRHFIPLLFF